MKYYTSIELQDLPKSPLSPLEVQATVLSEQPVERTKVFFKNECVGYILPQYLSSDVSARWGDVQTSNKRKRVELSESQKSLSLLASLKYNQDSKPDFFESPFPHGCDSVEELAMVGAERFKTVHQCYQHWFKKPSPSERLTREFKGINLPGLSVPQLTELEELLRKQWKLAHQELIKRS